MGGSHRWYETKPDLFSLVRTGKDVDIGLHLKEANVFFSSKRDVVRDLILIAVRSNFVDDRAISRSSRLERSRITGTLDSLGLHRDRLHSGVQCSAFLCRRLTKLSGARFLHDKLWVTEIEPNTLRHAGA